MHASIRPAPRAPFAPRVMTAAALWLLAAASPEAVAKTAANAPAAAPRPALFDGRAPEPATAPFADRRVEAGSGISRAIYAPNFTASPAGTTVTLLDRPGFPPGNGCNNVNMDVTFDSASAFNLENHCAGTNPWYVGVGAPTQSLNAFNGQSTSGTWKLIVTDPVAGGTGSIVDWELLTTPTLSSSCDTCTVTGAPIAATGGVKFSLEPSRPNPFSGATEIRFALGTAGPASLRVYDVGGRHVATLADGLMNAGAHTATWNGTDASGRAVAGGIYFYRLTNGEGTKIERMQLLR